MRNLLFILLLVGGQNAWAQISVDSLPGTDSLQRRDSMGQRLTDSLQRVDSLYADSLSNVPPPIRDTLRPILQHSFYADTFRYRNRLFYSFTNSVRYTVSVREWQGKEVIFYTIAALLIILALIKNSFRRYLSDLFSAYFRTTVRQRQIKEQLLQNPLPSLLFNIFFVLSGALFLALLFQHFSLAGNWPFWMLGTYSVIALAIIYAGKFVLLKFFGWVFRLSPATDTYIFVVFSTNKVLGILLLPFSILLAFSSSNINQALATLGLIMVGCLFVYRYFLAFISINSLVPFSVFHFLLYLAAMEILPLLLINKLLFIIVREIS